MVLWNTITLIMYLPTTLTMYLTLILIMYLPTNTLAKFLAMTAT